MPSDIQAVSVVNSSSSSSSHQARQNSSDVVCTNTDSIRAAAHASVNHTQQTAWDMCWQLTAPAYAPPS
jgi:hypothetical protein